MAKRGLRNGALAAGAAACALIGVAAAQDNIGVTAAVNPQAQGTPPDRATRTLNVGLDMFKSERVTTGPEGKTQLLFIDGSALSIGPNSDVVLDEFVYDPKTESGKLAMTATKGVFRLVGGKLSKNEPVTLKTPTATIGIRGGVGTIVLPDPGVPPGGAFVSLDFGKVLTVEGIGADNQPVTQTVTRAGTGVPFAPGGALLPPVPIGIDLLSRALSAVEGVRGRSGGASEQPTEGRVAASAVARQSAANDSDTLGSSDSDSDALSGAGAASRVNLARASQVNFLSSFQSRDAFQDLALSGRYKTTPGSGIAKGPGDKSSAFNRALFGDILGSLFSGFTLGLSGSSSSFDNDYLAPVTGTLVETTQRGNYFSFSSGGTTSPFGPISGKVFLSSMSDFVFFSNVEENFSNERSIAFAGLPTPPSVLAPGFGILTYRIDADAVMGSNLAFLMAASGGNLAGVRSNAFVSPSTPNDPTFLQGNFAISGQGLAQKSAATFGVGRLVASLLGTNVNLDGRVRGSVRMDATQAAGFISGPLGFSTDAFGNGVYGIDGPNYVVLESSQISVGATGSTSFIDFGATSLPDPVGLNESSGSILGSTLYFPTNFAQRIDTSSGVGVARQSRNFTGFANGFIDTFNTAGSFTGTYGSPFISNGSSFQLNSNATLNTLSGTINGVASPNSFVMPFGGSTADGRSAFIDDKLYAAVEATTGATRNGIPVSSFQMYIVGNELVKTTDFLPAGTSFCDCTFSTFGFWGVDLSHATGRDRIHLGQFVAGLTPPQVPSIGSASYAGHAVADIVTMSGARFKAGASFNMSYLLMTAQVTSWNVNFGGGNVISGSSSGGSAGSPTFTGGTFSGSVPVLGAGVSGSFSGAFFGGSISVVPPEVGTQFQGGNSAGNLVGVTQGKCVPTSGC